MFCEVTGNCQEKECPPGQNLCRTTVMHTWQENEDLEVAVRGCAHPEKTTEQGEEMSNQEERIAGKKLLKE